MKIKKIISNLCVIWLVVVVTNMMTFMLFDIDFCFVTMSKLSKMSDTTIYLLVVTTIVAVGFGTMPDEKLSAR